MSLFVEDGDKTELKTLFMGNYVYLRTMAKRILEVVSLSDEEFAELKLVRQAKLNHYKNTG